MALQFDWFTRYSRRYIVCRLRGWHLRAKRIKRRLPLEFCHARYGRLFVSRRI